VKTCTKCGVAKPLSAFAARRKKSGTLQSWCRDCHKARAAERYARMTTEQRDDKRRRDRERAARLRRLLWDRLSNASCVDCGESDILVLEFDHVGEKLGNVTDIAIRRPWALVEQEISRCEIRCANCHRRRTAQRRAAAIDAGVELVQHRKSPPRQRRLQNDDAEPVSSHAADVELAACSRCGLAKPITAFAWHTRRIGIRQRWCRDCHNAHKRAFYAMNRAAETARVARRRAGLVAQNSARIRAFLESNPCVDCGENETIVLEFDHIADKKRDVTRMVNSGLLWATIEREIAKCQVRCVNCHRRRTAQQQGFRDRKLGLAEDLVPYGDPGGTRTPDFFVRSEALYPLSYGVNT
jgi:hypothetical protein